jgi:hypothetical protein
MDAQTEQILAELRETGLALAENKPGAREQLMHLGRKLASNLELPSEAIQRMGWAEVRAIRLLISLHQIITYHWDPACSRRPLSCGRRSWHL